jgi:hypothetical protein
VESTQLGPIERAILCLWTPATTPAGFTKPVQYNPATRVNFFHTLNLHTCMYMHCFVANIIKITVLSEQKSSLEIHFFSTISAMKKCMYIEVGHHMCVWKFKVQKMLTLIVGVCCVDFVNPIGFVVDVCRQRLALSIGSN